MSRSYLAIIGTCFLSCRTVVNSFQISLSSPIQHVQHVQHVEHQQYQHHQHHHQQHQQKQKNTRSTFQLYSSNDENTNTNEPEPEAELILGKNISDALQGLGSEAGYLAAAKKRSEVEKLKLLEKERREEEEAEAMRQRKAEFGVDNNYGPTDSDFEGWTGFQEDGFDASADDATGWDGHKAGEEGGDEGEGDAPSLWLGDEPSSDSGLLL